MNFNKPLKSEFERIEKEKKDTVVDFSVVN